jgi:hypothetical protein
LDLTRNYGERLPVAAVTAAIASIAPTAAAAPAATTAMSTVAAASTASTTTAMTAPTASAASPFTLRTRLIDHQRAAEKLPAVQSRDGLFRLRVVPDFREAETARLAGEAITKQSKSIGLHARFRK